MRIATIVFFCVLFSLDSYSQILKGRIVEQNSSKPIDAASVNLTDANDMVVAFALTDEKGYFQIELNGINSAKHLFVSSIGHKSKKIPIETYKNGSTTALESSDVALKEVVVKSEPIRRTGDTLNYNVSSFRLAQDRNIRDVLKRLPGIEIEDNGQIKYEGKAINKFYVENMDLTDGKYNLISNNLAAKSVKTVQVMENHQPVNALRGINFSDQAALNLLLEDNSKGKIMGAVDLGIGMENKDKLLWENRLTALAFDKKIQDISLYKNSNTGTDIKEDLIDFGSGINYSQMQGQDDESGILSQFGGNNSSGLDKKRWLFNSSHFVSTNTLKKLSKDKFFRFQASYLSDNLSQNSGSYTSYFLPDTTLTISELSKVKDKNSQIEARLGYESNTDKNFLKNTTKVNLQLASEDGVFTSSNPVNQQTELNKLSISNDLNFVHRINQDKALKFTFLNSYFLLPQKISINPGLYEELTGEGKNNEKMVQNVNISSFKSHLFSSFSHSLFFLGIDYDFGVDLESQLLKSHPDGNTSDLLENFSDSLENKFRHTDLSFYLRPTIRYQREYLKISVGLKSSLSNIFNNDLLKSEKCQAITKFIFEPTFSLNYDYNAYFTVRAGSYYFKNYPDIHSLYTSYILASYKAASKYEGTRLSTQASFGNNFGIYYKQPITGLFVNMSASFTRQFSDKLSNTTFDGIFQRSSYVNVNTANNNLTLTFNFEKKLSFIASVFKVHYNDEDNNYSQILSGIFTNSNVKTHTVSSELTFSPSTKFNIEGSGQMQFQQLEQVYPILKKYPSLRNEKYKLNLNFFPSKKFSISLKNELYRNNRDNTTSFFSDFFFSYLFKKNEIQLCANNLFNKDEYEKNYVSSISQSLTTSPLRKRQFLIKYYFNF